MIRALSLAILAAAAVEAQSIRPEVELRDDVVYCQGSGRDLHADVFLPKSAPGKRPAVLFFHGGGWAVGDYNRFRYLPEQLAGRGYVTATVQYRFSGEAKFPAAVEDAKCSVRWMRARAAEFGVDPDRIAVGGGSSGGHLAVLLGLTEGEKALEGSGGYAGVSSRVQAVIGLNAALDLEGAARNVSYIAGDRIEQFMGAPYAQIPPEKWRLASPLSRDIRPGTPPMLLLHGTADEVVPYSQAVRMRDRLAAAKVPVELFTAEGAAHGFFNSPAWREKVLHAIEDYLDRRLRGRGARNR